MATLVLDLLPPALVHDRFPHVDGQNQVRLLSVYDQPLIVGGHLLLDQVAELAGFRRVDGIFGASDVDSVGDEKNLRWNAPIDLLFIDGDHSTKGCRRDWDLFHPHVTAGGRVAFHDARLDQPDGRGLAGPTEVVDTLFRAGPPPRGWAIETEVDRTVVV
ncbi:MAG: class I SAM-dependent methyltransferase, partial [Acidobacteria bacterium]|nr:class I SAM-dependent methyltransferase [Acidobacteriota bacterium]